MCEVFMIYVYTSKCSIHRQGKEFPKFNIRFNSSCWTFPYTEYDSTLPISVHFFLSPPYQDTKGPWYFDDLATFSNEITKLLQHLDSVMGSSTYIEQLLHESKLFYNLILSIFFILMIMANILQTRSK